MFGASFDGESNVDQLETSRTIRWYEFSNVAPQQNYALTVVAEGYGKVILPDIAVLETEDTVKDIVLEIASLAGQVISASCEPIEGVSVGRGPRTRPSATCTRRSPSRTAPSSSPTSPPASTSSWRAT